MTTTATSPKRRVPARRRKARARRSYQSSPIKRIRRTKGDILALRDTLHNVVKANRPMTVRQVFYQMVTLGAIDKTEAAYNGIVVRLLGVMRREGQLPFRWIADSTRWMRKPDSYSSLRSMLENSIEFYRRNLWDSQDTYVEVWLEKEALAGVLYEATAEWDVPLMVTRGYPSLSYLHTAAETMQGVGKPCYLYYFGDLDPSGVDIPRRIERDLNTFAPDADINFRRVAVTREQVEEMGLPTRPTKTKDTRAKFFIGESVEVDAIPPVTLRSMVSELIEAHIDSTALKRIREIEAAERSTLATVMSTLDSGSGEPTP